jgi:hypothetical protein
MANPWQRGFGGRTAGLEGLTGSPAFYFQRARHELWLDWMWCWRLKPKIGLLSGTQPQAGSGKMVWRD